MGKLGLPKVDPHVVERKRLVRQGKSEQRAYFARARENATTHAAPTLAGRQCSDNIKKGGSTGFVIRGGVSGKQPNRARFWVQEA